MKAIVFENPTVGLVFRNDVNIPIPGPGQAVVQIIAAALNRRDYWMTIGLYPNIKVWLIHECK
jgi:NADPH:quinone reductase-like Zn-dependent oxidoreductase